jgi:hypothetical protein
VSLIVEVWLKSLAYPSGEEGGKFVVQIISTCLRYTQRRGGGDPRPVIVTNGPYRLLWKRLLICELLAMGIVGSLYCNYLYPVILPLSFLSGERLTVSGGPFFCN